MEETAVYEVESRDIAAHVIKGNSPEEDKATRKCSEWYERDKNAKRFVIDEWKEMYKLYKGEHWDILGSDGNALRSAEQQKNRPNCVENVTFTLIEGTASEFAQDVELVDFPVEQGDNEAATVMSEIKKYIFYKNKIASERTKLLRWFFLYGSLIWHPYWDPDWRGGRGPNRWEGDIRWKALHPLVLVPDARCKEDINEGNRCHKVIWHTMESVDENYPERAHLIQQEIQDEEDLLDTDQEDADGFNVYDSRTDMVPVIETWYKGRPLILGEGEEDLGSGLHVIWWAGEGQRIYLKHVNYIYFEPGETVTFPFFLKPRYHRENSVWGFGDAYFLKNPQIVLNKTAEIILEGHMHGAVGQTWYEENAVTEKQKKIIKEKGTLPGMWFAVRNIGGIKREYASNIPSTLQNEMSRLQKVMETIVGRFDVSQGKTPGSVTAFRAIAELSARAQVRLRLAEQAITAAYEEAGQFTNRLIGQFYTEERRYRIRGEKDEIYYKTYSQENMLKYYHFDTGESVPLAQVKPPGMGDREFQEHLAAMGVSEGDYEIYFPEFDTMCKVTSVVPADRIYHMEIAKELLTTNIIDVETFLDVMKTGRFPPVEKVQERLQQKRQQELNDAMQKQMLSQQGVVLPAGQQAQQPGKDELVELIGQLPEDVRAELAALPPGQLIPALQEILAGGGGGVAPFEGSQ